MILYHGTSYNNFQSIVNNKEISVTSDENSHYPKEGHAKTRRGYVYLTDLPLVALEFGSKCWLENYGKDNQLLTVLKINLPEDSIEPDPDEEKWNSTSVANGKYYRINRAIDYDKEVCKVAYFQFSSYQACCDYLDKNESNKIIWSSKNYKIWENGDIRIMKNDSINIEFKKISEFPKGTLYTQLVDAYSFNDDCQKNWDNMWKEYDDFFYSNLEQIADKYGFVTIIDGVPVGHISWDPRNRFDSVSIGHNCILSNFKGKGYGKIQLQEAIRRIKEYDVNKIIVTTNEITLPAQKNYESVGFVKVGERINKETPFAGKYIDYEMVLK